jgi:hypothetical protein
VDDVVLSARLNALIDVWIDRLASWAASVSIVIYLTVK